MEGLQTTRQVSLGKLDLAWHALESMNSIEKVKDTEDLAFKNIELLPDIESNCMSTAFGHIFQGGYSSGYYSYKWAEVLDADAFAYLKKKEYSTKKLAKNYRK